jgi:LysR family transcriptional regulator, regulator of abg operon
MRHFDAVARHSSLHGAARALGVAQSALSRSIRELEHDLGVELLLRSARGVELTAAGERFLIRARRVQAEIEQGRQEAAQVAGEQVGTVTVGLSSAAQLVAMPAMVRRFRRAWPGVRLDVVEGELPDLHKRVADGTIDFCIAAPSPASLSPGLRQERVVTMEQAIFCRVGHPAMEAATLDEMGELDWIELGAMPWLSLPGGAAMRVPNLLSAATLIAGSDMVAVLPRMAVEASSLAAKLDIVEIHETPPDLPLGAFARTGLPLTPAAQYLYDSAINLFENGAPGPPFGRRTPLMRAPVPEVRTVRT